MCRRRSLAVSAFLILLVAFTAGCPRAEETARDSIAVLHGYVAYAQTEWLTECKANPRLTKCDLTNRAIAAEYMIASSLDIYCSGPPSAGQVPYANGGACVPVRDGAAALQQAIMNARNIISQFKIVLGKG